MALTSRDPSFVGTASGSSLSFHKKHCRPSPRRVSVVERYRPSNFHFIAVCVCAVAAGSALLDQPPLALALEECWDSSISTAHVEIDETDEIEDKERKRRERIGLANKGRTPWNKGKKHSPATIALMKERNSVVMRDPKMREKLRQYSRPQSEDTKEKLRTFMIARMEFQRRQLSCVEDWKERIAETARLGALGDEELQWDSYRILKERMRQEHFEAVKRKKRRQRVRSWSIEERMKISEAVRAKWDDPAYRERVSRGMCEYHKRRGQQSKRRSEDAISFDDEMDQYLGFGNTENHEPTALGRYSKSTRPMDPALVDGLSTSSGSLGTKVGSYYDPLAKEKLERIKQLRARKTDQRQPLQTMTRTAQHGSNGTASSHEAAKKVEAVRRVEIDVIEQAQREATERARVLLAEAERAAIAAAKALEAVGTDDEGLKLSLTTARNLLDEANRSIISVEAGTLPLK